MAKYEDRSGWIEKTLLLLFGPGEIAGPAPPPPMPAGVMPPDHVWPRPPKHWRWHSYGAYRELPLSGRSAVRFVPADDEDMIAALSALLALGPL